MLWAVIFFLLAFFGAKMIVGSVAGQMNGYSKLALIGALVSVFLFATAAVLFINGTDSIQRLALLFGLFGVAVPAIFALLKADESATSTNSASNIAAALNGGFDQRVRNAMRTVNAEKAHTPIEAVNMPNDPTAHIPAGSPITKRPL